ncbi:MAG: excinuclease ABC subunit A [Calditrichaeota bacterium]|nr:MAG: excinuclease ABC subunit A [Calditrichota bacterium]
MSRHEDVILIRGARTHNLKNITLAIPREALTVVTGPSGAGKSSLAFDTLYAEGQRRYVESLSAYARQFLERMPRPDVDFISGLSPAVAIEQKNRTTSPRSTVGTVTEIYDYLRLLFARAGETYCVECGTPVRRDLPEDVWRFLEQRPESEAVLIAFPLPEAGGGQGAEKWLSLGFRRVWRQGQVLRLDRLGEDQSLAPGDLIVVDRLRCGAELDRGRAMESIETAFHYGEGELVVVTGEGALQRFSQRFACSRCGRPMVLPEPRLFSFNNPFGACPGCQGFGAMMRIDESKVIPDPRKSLRQGAIAPWNTPHYRWFYRQLARVAPQYHIPLDVPYASLPASLKKLIWQGAGDYPGVEGFFQYLESKKYKVQVRVLMARYRSYFPCTACGGLRLRPEALAVKIGGRNISQLARLPVDALYNFLDGLSFPQSLQPVTEPLLKEIKSRLKYLLDVGLEYLTLDRKANTLSGGEYQRINLASALGFSLTGALYVLDEPTVGLHPRDTRRLIGILQALRDAGNTVVVVEHDPEVIRSADYIVDLGPGSGEHGGQLVFQGDYPTLLAEGEGLTARYMREERAIPAKTVFRKGNGKALVVRGAREHNLKNLTVRFPLGKLVCVTGVSGSGKSTLVHEVLYRGILKARGQAVASVGACEGIEGLNHIYQVEMVDQSPIGRTPRSNPVTYIKAFDAIRKLFASTPAALRRGFKPGHFSFNVPGGRCEVCQGDGQIKVEMQFLADVYLECEACKGKRFKPEVLQVKYRGKSIVDVLEMSVAEALNFFADQPRLVNSLQVLQQVGLEYLRLGQPATTLSSGEAQRIKLAAHLIKKNHQNNLYILDEPTTGLHLDDIARLLRALDALIERGASIILIEHHPDVIKYADWVIDLGPEGGDRGGRIVAQGTPVEIARQPASYTGQILQKIYAREGVQVA